MQLAGLGGWLAGGCQVGGEGCGMGACCVPGRQTRARCWRPAPTSCAACSLATQEALWRLDEVLESAMAGVRLGDGTTWVKSRGYTWVLGSYMAAKLYPQGERGRRLA